MLAAALWGWGRLVAALSWMFRTKLGQWCAGIMVFLGISFATQQAVVGPGVDQIESLIAANSATAGTAVQWMAFLNFDKAISIVLSAYAARAAVRLGKVSLVKATGS